MVLGVIFKCKSRNLTLASSLNHKLRVYSHVEQGKKSCPHKYIQAGIFKQNKNQAKPFLHFGTAILDSI